MSVWNYVPIVKYVFVVLAACGREGEFVDSEDEVRVDKRRKNYQP
jgi:hypothetical protein